MSPTLDILERLVAFDTRNPPRDLSADSDVFRYLRSQLQGFDIALSDEGAGSLSLLATRGAPDTLFNYHLDTVPVAEGWQRDPFKLHVGDTRATGLGACDIKGALAAMLAASQATDGDLALLISSDEEAGNSTCINRYLSRKPSYQRVIVAEPTMGKAVTSHRGILSGRIEFIGHSGHASSARALNDNAIHRAMNWGAAAQRAVQGLPPAKDTPLNGTRFNIGRFEGGVKPNMIAASATASFNVRTPPAQDQQEVIDALQSLAPAEHRGEFTLSFQAPALPNAERGQQAINEADALAQRNQLALADPVDFWTEASLFCAAGMTAIVLGSGDIAQAHTADEWVEIEQLDKLHNTYTRLIRHGIQ
ncbi:MAG: acetylornithine deacetylase [Gammaproteobacteria bacterium]